MYVNICKVQVWNVKKKSCSFYFMPCSKRTNHAQRSLLANPRGCRQNSNLDPSSPAHLFRISRRTRNLRDSMIHKILPNLSWSAAKMCLFYCWIALKPSKCFCFQTDTSQGVVEKLWNSYQGGTLTSTVTFLTWNSITRLAFWRDSFYLKQAIPGVCSKYFHQIYIIDRMQLQTTLSL